jgi:hypothetical protein
MFLICLKRLPRLCLDHYHILLDCGEIQSARRHFKFDNMWLKAEGFVDSGRVVIFLSFSKAPQTFFFSHKLKALKADLKVWNEQCLAIWRTRKKNLLGELIVIDGLEKEGVLHDKEKQRKDCYW